ncbi:MAG TPA: LLM class flavin-dependent oxidoreductase [Solirubrobacteraceae bacterium]|nr:LLM class flavin-dependent oxidoreductase [Solirubrobacteraceae bacterium]
MDVGIGLPNAVPGTTRRQLLDWARAADQAGFSSLGTIDRIVFPNYEPLVALTAAAAVTERIRLASTVMLGPLRINAALVAKQVLSLDAVAGGGRAILGIGLGGRGDDYEVSGVSLSGRGAWQDRALAQIRRIFDGDGDLEAKIGPRPQGVGPRLIVGGSVAASFERAARYGDGWIMGGGRPEQFAGALEQLDAAWSKHGRDGTPRRMALAYYGLGENAERDAHGYLTTYYAFLGEELSRRIAGGAATDPDTVKAYVAAFERAGCDELVIFPSSADPAQVDLLADAVWR